MAFLHLPPIRWLTSFYNPPLFSNIEIDRRNRIIEMYAQETKQIFISIDSIEVLSKKAQEIIRENTVLTLERGGKELFGRSWNEQATK